MYSINIAFVYLTGYTGSVSSLVMDRIDTAPALIAALGRKRLRDLLGVSNQAITNAIRAGLLPGAWHAVVKQEADRQGIHCPASLFRIRANVDAAA